jgi:hypothetical protein
MLIEAPDFAIENDLRVLALQGDWGLTNLAGPGGGRLVVSDRARARTGCERFLESFAASDAQLAFVPELAIPIEAVPTVLAAVRNAQRSVAFIGGIEGLTREHYETLLLEAGGQAQPLTAGTGGYINALLIAVRTPTRFISAIRAKRIPARAESEDGPPMTLGAGPFTRLELGAQPLTIVPLICSEFVWPEELWRLLDAEVPRNIDVIPVLQHNADIQARHTGPQLHQAYSRGDRTGRARFIFINQAIDEHCDGTCYVVVPPNSPGAPTFNHSYDELWHLPGIATYKGFRIPDRTGCIWSALIRSPHAGTSALGTRLCSGFVSEVLVPSRATLRGLAFGLMRNACVVLRKLADSAQPDVRAAVTDALSCGSAAYVLRSLDTAAAKEVLFRMQCAELPAWGTVETVVTHLVEVSALLACGGDSTALIPCEGGNCALAGKAVSILYAPNVDEALISCFSASSRLEASPIPSAVVLVGVVMAASAVGAYRLGEILRADRVTTPSNELIDMPVKSQDSAATIRIDDVEFRSLAELKANLAQPNVGAARIRLQQLFPKAYV